MCLIKDQETKKMEKKYVRAAPCSSLKIVGRRKAKGKEENTIYIQGRTLRP